MIIKELNLIGFGKFKNQEVHLKEGLNIVYGENEDGKSTIHNFINGMFYGFLRPYVKRTIYLDEHDKYNPWDNSKYRGIIKFSFQGEDYRIEREFTKSNESTQVLIDATGEDITNSIDNGNSGRVLQPGNHFFGFNHGVYSNTISIKQLENKTEELLANEVRDKLVNISTTLDDELSVENAIENLENSLKEIGTIRGSKSLYGSIYEALENNKRERKEILKDKDEYNTLLEKNKEYKDSLDIKIDELEKLKLELKNTRIFNNKKILDEALNLKSDIDLFKKQIYEYEKYRDLEDDDYFNIIKSENRIENIRGNIFELRKNLQETIEEKQGFTSEYSSSREEQDEIIEKYIEYENLEEDRENISNESNKNHLEFLKRDFIGNKRTKDKYQSTLVVTAFVLIASILGSIFLKNYLFLSVNFIGIPLGVFSFIKFQKLKENVDKIKAQITQGQEKNKEMEKTLDIILKRQKKILNSMGLASKAELKILENRIQNQIYRKEEKEKRHGVLDEKIKRYKDEISKLNEEEEKEREKTRELLKKNLATSLEEFKTGLEFKQIYEETILNLKNKEEILNRVLNGNTIENLSMEMQINEGILKEIDYRDIDMIKKDIDTKGEEISSIRIINSRLEERLNSLNDRIKRLVEVEENINKKEKKLQNLDEKRESLELAMETLILISKNIHKEFAPKLNKTIGDIIEEITNGKYSNVKIDDSLEIGVVNPDTKEIIDINSLSGGTIDQLYFSLRFAIAESFNRKSLPLILDDCFIQYDNMRLENIIKFLASISKSRQIILFTCHKREVSILHEMGFEYNLVNLSWI